MHTVGPPHPGLPMEEYRHLLKKKFAYKWTCKIQTHVVQGQFYMKNQVKNQLLRTFTNLRLHLRLSLQPQTKYYTPNYKTKKATLDLCVLMNATRNDLKYMIYIQHISNLKIPTINNLENEISSPKSKRWHWTSTLFNTEKCAGE